MKFILRFMLLLFICQAPLLASDSRKSYIVEGIEVSPLIYAAVEGDMALIESALATSTDVNQTVSSPRDEINDISALMIAVKQNHVAIVKRLIDAGANVNQSLSSPSPKYDGISILTHAVQQNNLETLSLLIDAGANLDHQDALGRTTLMHAINARDQSLVDYLMRQSMNLNLKDGKGDSAMNYLYRQLQAKQRQLDDVKQDVQACKAAYSSLRASIQPE